MFKAVVEKDKYGKTQTRFILTQGDSCTIRSTPKKDGELLPVDRVEQCIFKLSDEDYNEQFSKELELENGKFVLRLTSDETREFAIEDHLYEIEYTLTGGEVQTPHSWTFEIIDQIKNNR